MAHISIMVIEENKRVALSHGGLKYTTSVVAWNLTNSQFLNPVNGISRDTCRWPWPLAGIGSLASDEADAIPAFEHIILIWR